MSVSDAIVVSVYSRWNDKSTPLIQYTVVRA